MSSPRLFACNRCNRHAFESSARCPHCGAPPRTVGGRVARAAAALTMSVGVMTWACAAYGVAPSGNCSDDYRCKECLVCARGGGSAVDAASCSSRYEPCQALDGSCADAPDQACCAFDQCLNACGDLDDAAAWECACGSTSPDTCVVDSAPAGTCAGDHPEGAAAALGADGWLSCALDLCDSSCSP